MKNIYITVYKIWKFENSTLLTVFIEILIIFISQYCDFKISVDVSILKNACVSVNKCVTKIKSTLRYSPVLEDSIKWLVSLMRLFHADICSVNKCATKIKNT